MNTADRSIGMVDYALRRRFTWFEFLADPEILEKWLTSKKGKVTKSRAKRVRELMEKVNEIIADSEMGKDCEMGQSYFMKEKIDKNQFIDTSSNEKNILSSIRKTSILLLGC